jgi:16S rRNA (adenine1518-N6/adenine1519-N6)-dimethyltransferase
LFLEPEGAAGATRLPTSRRAWTGLLADLGIRPSKGMGQNFLFERGVVQKLVRHAEVAPGDTVVEVGPGLGILTEELLRLAGRVIAVELDDGLAVHLRRTFGDDPRFTLVEGDALDLDWDVVVPAGHPWSVAANLPYSVGSAVVRRLLETTHRPRRLTVMLQLEVAQRLVARPPEMSVLSVATQVYADARIAFRVPPGVFIPPPKVESAVVVLDTKEDLPLPADALPTFFRIVNAGFRQKRKQVANSLAGELGMPKATVAGWLASVGIDPARRAETLAVAEWVALTVALPADGAA